MRFFDSLSYVQKFILVSVFFVIPMVVIIYFEISVQRQAVHVEELPITSDHYQKAAQVLLDTLSKQKVAMILCLLSMVTGLILGFTLVHSIKRSFNNLANAAGSLAKGELSTRIQAYPNDAAGLAAIAFNKMAEMFQALVGRLQKSGIQLGAASTEMEDAAKQQETIIIAQEATTKEIAVTAKDISTTAKELAKTMNDINTTAEQKTALATTGKTGLNQMEITMHQMVEASQNIAAKLGMLNERAINITSIITTISKVADQTNLLSLNAAIEAEKAGEHGRSFSVIAREIRRLADQTANATLDIEKQVTEMVSAVSISVMSVDKFHEEILQGVKQVAVVSEQLSKILEQVELQTQRFENINKTMQAQSLGAEQINDSINLLSETARHASDSIRQFHLSIQQLNDIAHEMQTGISKIT